MLITPKLDTYNAGYQIIAATPVSVGEYVVMGMDPAGNCVTWRTHAHDRYASYYSGRYFPVFRADTDDCAFDRARRDMAERAGIWLNLPLSK
jgi:hypothetical protein